MPSPRTPIRGQREVDEGKPSARTGSRPLGLRGLPPRSSTSHSPVSPVSPHSHTPCSRSPSSPRPRARSSSLATLESLVVTQSAGTAALGPHSLGGPGRRGRGRFSHQQLPQTRKLRLGAGLPAGADSGSSCGFSRVSSPGPVPFMSPEVRARLPGTTVVQRSDPSGDHGSVTARGQPKSAFPWALLLKTCRKGRRKSASLAHSWAASQSEIQNCANCKDGKK